MERFNIVKLKFTSPLHLHRGRGDYDVGETILHSDTISSAICAASYQLFNDFDGEVLMKNFLVSSAFPFIGETYFFPKPMIKLPLSISEYKERTSAKEAKLLKKLKFIDQSFFERIINAESDIEISKEDFKVNRNYLTREDIKPPYSLTTQQRVTVARDNSESMPYYLERMVFNKGAGLFFIYKCEDSEILEKAIGSLLLLGDAGIGTDRNVGNGQFEINLETINLDLPESDYSMLLSLYCPLKEEIEAGILEGSSYQLIKRGGYVAGATNISHRHLKKKSIYMFSESSVFKSRSLEGKIVNLRPDWNDESLGNVWRSGRPLTIPIRKV